MSSPVQAEKANTAAASAAPAGMRSEIAHRWAKFTAAEVTALKDKDDLIAQVQSKYSIERAQALTEVDAFAKGRSL
jgi:hypothetical protein